jgi:hypothetical protein
MSAIATALIDVSGVREGCGQRVEQRRLELFVPPRRFRLLARSNAVQLLQRSISRRPRALPRCRHSARMPTRRRSPPYR